MRLKSDFRGDILASAQITTKCSYKHTRSQTNVTQTRISQSQGHAHIHSVAACIQPESCQLSGDLWENRTPPVPLSSAHEPREALRPTGATSIFSLIPSLIAARPLFSIGQFVPVFVLHSHRSCCSFWSQSTGFRAIIFNRIKAISDGEWSLETRRDEAQSLGGQYCQMFAAVVSR